MKGCIFFLMIVLLLCWGKHGEVAAEEVQSSFHIGEEKKEGSIASFYIEEKKEKAKIEKRWNVRVGGLVYGTVTMGQVHYFIARINNWYRDELFKNIEWVGPPPYLDLGLSGIENVTGYYGEIVYLLNPGFGIGVRYDNEKTTTSKFFEDYRENEDESQKRWINGHVSVGVSLSGPSLLVFFRIPGFAGDLDASFYLGAGSYTGKINWEISESWEAETDEIPWEPWENSWSVSGKGNSIGYEAGIDLSYPFSDTLPLFVFLNLGYRSILIKNLNYEETVEKELEGEVWINEINKPSNLDFSGIAGRIGIGFNL